MTHKFTLTYKDNDNGNFSGYGQIEIKYKPVDYDIFLTVIILVVHKKDGTKK